MNDTTIKIAPFTIKGLESMRSPPTRKTNPAIKKNTEKQLNALFILTPLAEILHIHY